MKDTTLSAIEGGRRQPKDEFLSWLSKKYGVSLEEILMNKYWPQLTFLTGIMKPSAGMTNITTQLHPDDQEEVVRYAAFLQLKRYAISSLEK